MLIFLRVLEKATVLPEISRFRILPADEQKDKWVLFVPRIPRNKHETFIIPNEWTFRKEQKKNDGNVESLGGN